MRQRKGVKMYSGNGKIVQKKWKNGFWTRCKKEQTRRYTDKIEKEWEERCIGSFTVEATMLMTILLSLLFALIYMGFYQHDKAWIANRARVAAMESAVDKEKTDGVKWDGILGSRSVSGSVVRNNKCAQVQAKGSFYVPGITARLFAGGQLSVDCNVKISIKNAKKEIQKYRNVKRLAEG